MEFGLKKNEEECRKFILKAKTNMNGQIINLYIYIIIGKTERK